MSSTADPTVRSQFSPDELRFFSPLTLGLAAGQVVFLLALAYLDLLVYFPLVCIGVALLYASMNNLLVWLPFAILGHVVLFLQKTGEVTMSELAFGVLFYGVLLFWLLKKFFVERESLSTANGDTSLFLFFGITLLSFVPAVMYENNLFLWFREYLVFIGLLFYFPLREAMKRELGRKIVLGTFVVLALFIALRNVWEYKSRLALAAFAWEVLSGRQAANEPLFMVMILVGIAVWMVYSQIWIRLIALAVVSFFSVALIMTFSRGYWLGTAVGFIVLLWLGNSAERKRLIGITALVGVSALVVLVIGFSDMFFALLTTIGSRLTSAATAIQDRSFVNRLLESAEVIEHISVNPFVGYGLGADFMYYDILKRFSNTGEYVHNAYLFLWFKLGLPGLVVFMVAYGAKIVQGVRNLRGAIEEQYRPWVLAATTILIVMLQVNITSPQFYARDSVMIIALCWAIIAVSTKDTKEISRENLR